MNVCILGDVHFGVRADSKVFAENFRKFYTEVFFPSLVERDVKHIYQLGDLFDRRKYINFLTLAECKDYFFDKAKALGIEVHVLLGNHDIFWRESLEVNSPRLLLAEYDNVFLYSEPMKVKMGNRAADIIPWICKENEDEIHSFINKSTSDICLGHFEILGFQMYRGVENHDDGLSHEMFEKYKRVYSGHYHHKSTAKNITYVGTPCEHTWQDHDDPKGFHIMDTDTLEIEFIRNPFTMFTKFYYDEDEIDLKKFDPSSFADKHVKVVVVNKKDFYKFDRFMERAYKTNPIEIKIIEDFSEFEADSQTDEELNVEDTLSLLSQYVDAIDTDADKDKIKTLMRTLYVEAQNVDEE